MNWIVKSALKIMMVIVLPIVIGYITVFEIILDPDMSWSVIILAVFFTIVSLLNALMYTVFMSQTKMFPRVDIDFVPMIGIAFGIDNRDQYSSWIILLPFITIEFTKR